MAPRGNKSYCRQLGYWGVLTNKKGTKTCYKFRNRFRLHKSTRGRSLKEGPHGGLYYKKNNQKRYVTKMVQNRKIDFRYIKPGDVRRLATGTKSAAGRILERARKTVRKRRAIPVPPPPLAVAELTAGLGEPARTPFTKRRKGAIPVAVVEPVRVPFTKRRKGPIPEAPLVVGEPALVAVEGRKRLRKLAA